MPGNKLAATVVLCGLAAIASGCATTNAPRDWLSPPGTSQSQAYGGWFYAHSTAGAQRPYTDGELIALTADSIFILNRHGLVGLQKTQIIDATVTAYDARVGTLAAYSIIGTLSTISNGGFLLITAPLWAITGIVATASASNAPQEVYPKKKWEQFRKYARFPAGMPHGLNRQSLQPKPEPHP